MKYLLTLILFACTTFFAQAQVMERNQLPSVVVKTLDGEEVDLANVAEDGKLTVISLWATWCTPCKKELNNMSELLPDWKEDYDVQLVAVSVDDARNSMKVRPYVNGAAWDFTVLLDENSDTKRALNWSSIPYTIVVDGTGNIVYKHTGYTEGDEYLLEDKLAELSELGK